jgi:hypothetical protein
MLKVVVFYNQGARGFTEVWYSAGSTPPTVLSLSQQAFLTQSIGFRAPGTVITGLRFSQIGGTASYTFRLGNFYTAPGYVNPTITDDVVSTTALCQIYDSTYNRKNIFLRGLRDADVVRGPTGIDTPTATLTKAITAYLNAAVSAGFLMQIQQNPTNTPALSYNPIIDIQSGSVSNLVTRIVLANAPGFNLGNPVFIRILGVPPNLLPGLPKIVQVQSAVNVGTFSVDVNVFFRSPQVVFPPRGKIIINLYNYPPPLGIQFIGFGEHKTGRAFYQPRGRKSVAIRRL